MENYLYFQTLFLVLSHSSIRPTIYYHLSVHLSICLSINPFNNPSIHPSIHPSILLCLYVYPFVFHPSIHCPTIYHHHLSVHQSIHPKVHQFSHQSIQSFFIKIPDIKPDLNSIFRVNLLKRSKHK
ncbi:hypothetical protein ATANTOWER_001071 [Ataeniobius toweri]|uniref:Uncharacterized protein n=1 Tax=Ataeniobius toweri TaxID=208326 RepID=A0ABU7CHJ6_9TELE|nr:hypothetical protein [Ataeniobius toweri]